MKRIIFLLLTTVSLFFACAKQDDVDAVEVRVYNSTSVQIEAINISGTDRAIVFTALDPGFTTGYKALGFSGLANPTCSIYVKGQPNPYISSDPDLTSITKGNYTCQIKYNNTIPSVKFTRE